jgi:hypothetical protein
MVLAKDWRVRRAALERDFAAAAAIAPGRLDLMISGARRRYTLSPTPLLDETLRGALTLLDESTPPSALFEDERYGDQLLSACARSLPNHLGVKDQCYGRAIDVTGDGVREYLVARFSAPFEPATAIYAESGGDWRQIGWTAELGPATWWDDIKNGEEEIVTHVARRRREIAAAITTAPPLLADLDMGGARLVFNYD